MRAIQRVAVVSDIHFASAAECARGADYETRIIANPAARLFLRFHRRYVWLREPLKKNYLLDDFLSRADADFLVANGDFSCDTGFVGVADDGSLDSVSQCLARMRSVYGERMAVTWGDHDLGKKSFYGTTGGMRLESARLLENELGAPAFWEREFNGIVFAGVSSSLVALDALEEETLPEEREGWRMLRQEHMNRVRTLFAGLKPDQKLVLFCHDPSALPFLFKEEAVRSKLNRIERTVIGHLHSAFILKQSRLLAGMPQINFLGYTARKLSRALRQARLWKPFKVELCPSLAGMELFKDGGYGLLELRSGSPPCTEFTIQKLPR